MGGRRFDSPNKAVPACVERMAATPPACFEKAVWRMYLLDHYRGTLNDAAARARLNRDEVPDFCDDCTAGYRASMQAAGRCNPPSPSPDPAKPEQQLAAA